MWMGSEIEERLKGKKDQQQAEKAATKEKDQGVAKNVPWTQSHVYES